VLPLLSFIPKFKYNPDGSFSLGIGPTPVQSHVNSGIRVYTSLGPSKIQRFIMSYFKLPV